MATFRKRQRKKLGTPVNKPNNRKAHNLKHSLWEANDIIDIRLSQANDSLDMDECRAKGLAKYVCCMRAENSLSCKAGAAFASDTITITK